MSTSYYAYAVIGCEVTGKLYRNVEVRTPCIHADEGPIAKFCKACGKAQTKTECQPVEHFDADKGMLGGLKVVFGNTARNGRRAFVGIVKEAHDWPASANVVGSPIDPREMNAVAAIVHKELEPIGFWDEATFGLWAIMRVEA